MAYVFQIPNTEKGSTTNSSPTTNSLGQREDLPSEAMQFNGKYLEDQIDGYQTLYVRGRESMLAEINAYETGVRDGTGITSKRFPARELVIGYLLHAKSNEAFREAYNTLNGILYTQDAQIIFNDEVDKYFTGTPEGLDEIESGRNFVQGEILIYCADPFKYSITEKSANSISDAQGTDGNGKIVGITYNGTYKAYPRLEADFPNSSDADCGYVAWSIYNSSFTNNGKAIQLGNTEETDLGLLYKSETLFEQDTSNGSFDVDNPPSGWFINFGGKNSVMHVNVDADLWGGTGGDLACIKGESPAFLRPDTFEYDGVSVWTAVNVSRSIPNASDGGGAVNWKVTWGQHLSVGTGDTTPRRGGIQVIVTDSNYEVIAAANMYRSASDADDKGRLTVHTKNYKTSKTGIDFTYNNKYWGSATGGTCTMTKSGSKVSFNLGGLSFSLTDSEIENTVATRVTVVFLKTAAWPRLTEGIFNISVQNSSVGYWSDVANTFGKKDTVVADCTSGTITINKREDASLGVIGNDWEGFCLYPGQQNVRFTCSSWCKDEPTTYIYYREVFI